MAFSFHRTSPLHLGPFVHLDCARDEPKLTAALQAALAQVSAAPGLDPVRASWCGTLFLDGIAELSRVSQRLLLCFVRHALGGAAPAEGGWPLRLAVGNAEPLGREVERRSFLPELRDELDKIHVRLDPAQPLAAGVA